MTNMKISSICPNCSKEIIITGIKLVFDNPQSAKTERPKGYIGWNKQSSDSELKAALDNVENITNVVQLPPPVAPPQETQMIQDLHKVLDKGKETIKVNNTGDPNEDIRKLVQEEIDKRDKSVKQYDELMAQTKAQLISMLNKNVQPELNILSEKLLEQTQDSRNKGLCLVCNKAQSSPICNDCMTKLLLDSIQQGHMARLKVGW